MITKEHRDQLRKFALAATPGAWEHIPEGGMIMNVVPLPGGCRLEPGRFKIADIRGWGHLQYRPDGEAMQEANGDHIAAASPRTMLELLDVIDGLEQRLDAAQRALEKTA